MSGSRAEVKVDQDFATTATKSVTITRVHAPNQENLVLQTKEGAQHLIQEEPHPRVKEEKQARDQTHSG